MAISPNSVKVEEKVQVIVNDVKVIKHEQGRVKIDSWLLPPDPSTNLNKATEQRHASSGSWLLKSTAFAEWKAKKNSFLWLHGKPGCGKTVLSSTVISYLKRSIQPSQPVIYFFFDFADTSKQSFEKMIRSLISQLDYQSDKASQHLDSMFSSCKQGREQPNCDSLCTGLLEMLNRVGETWLVLDALDECAAKRDVMLSWLADILKVNQANIHVLVTSRPEHDIHVSITELIPKEAIIDIQGSSVTDDIRGFVHETVRKDKGLQRWQRQPDVQTQIETTLMEKTDGM